METIELHPFSRLDLSIDVPKIPWLLLDIVQTHYSDWLKGPHQIKDSLVVSLVLLLYLIDDLLLRESKTGTTSLQLDPNLVSSARDHYVKSFNWLRDLSKESAPLASRSIAASHHVYSENFQPHLNSLHRELEREYSLHYRDYKPYVEAIVNKEKERLESHRKGMRAALGLEIANATVRVTGFCYVSTFLPVSASLKMRKLIATSRPA
jgi:hypothetical protein